MSDARQTYERECLKCGGTNRRHHADCPRFAPPADIEPNYDDAPDTFTCEEVTAWGIGFRAGVAAARKGNS